MNSQTAKRAVYIYASEVAACIGKNPYKSKNEAFMNVLRRMDPDLHERVARETQYEDDAMVLQRVLPPERAAAVESRARQTSDRRDVEQVVQACVQQVKDSLPAGAEVSDREREKIERAIRSAAQTSVGIAREGGVLGAVNAMLVDQNIHFAPDARLYKRRMGAHNGREWYLCGRVDGLSSDRALVLEIKNRMRRLFGRVVEYEKIQMMCYQAMVDARRGLLAEALDPEHLGLHWIDFDEAEWQDVTAQLGTFAVDVIDALDATAAESAGP